MTSVWNTLTKLLLPVLGVSAIAVAGTAPVEGGWLAAGVMAVAIVAVVGALSPLARPVAARRLARLVQRPVAALARRTGREAPPDLPERAVALPPAWPCTAWPPTACTSPRSGPGRCGDRPRGGTAPQASAGNG